MSIQMQANVISISFVDNLSKDLSLNITNKFGISLNKPIGHNSIWEVIETDWEICKKTCGTGCAFSHICDLEWRSICDLVWEEIGL